MGRGVALCTVGIPNNFEEVHGRNFVLSNLQSGSSYIGRNKPVQCSGFKIRPRQEFRINAETVELIGRAPGISDYTASRISIKTCPKTQQGRKEPGIWSERSGTSEGSRECARCQRRKVSADLGRTYRVTAIAGAGAYYLEDLDK